MHLCSNAENTLTVIYLSYIILYINIWLNNMHGCKDCAVPKGPIAYYCSKLF